MRDAAWSTRRLLVCVGAGGVGKTSVSAAIALAAAMAGKRALVLTVDPARRLAGALGLARLPGQPAPVPADALAGAGLAPRAALSAMMLEQAGAWDRLVLRHASPAVAARLIGSRFYQMLSRRFAGSTEYLAIDELAELAGRDDFELIVLDTPPGERVLDLLAAPARARGLLDRRVLRWLPLGAGARTLGRAGGLLGRELEAATGHGALSDLAAFLSAAAELADVLGERAEAGRRLLAGPDTAILLVCSPEAHGIAAAAALERSIAALDLQIAGVIVNRRHLPWPGPVDTVALAAALRAGGLGADDDWLIDNFLSRERRARGEQDRLAALPAPLAHLPLTTIPELDTDVHDLGAVAQMAARLPG